MKLAIQNEEEMHGFAAQLAKAIEEGCYIYLFGLLGAGKTTFARGFLRTLGYSGKVKSPTYTLVEPYHVNQHEVFHFDLYRLNDAKELIQIGIQDYFTSQSICLVEWPEKGHPLLPVPDIACHINFVNNGRELIIESHTPRGERLIKKLTLLSLDKRT